MVTYNARYLETKSANLYVIFYFILVMFLPLLVNYVILNSKVDTFIATTLVQAKIIEVCGRICSDPVNVEVSLPNWYWQGHTLAYIENGLVIPGIETYIISAVTDLGVIVTVYLPIPHILSSILLYLIVKKICDDLQTSQPFTFIVLLLSMFVFIADYTLGRFYTMEYHSYSVALFLIMLYVFVNLWFNHINGRYDIARSAIIILLTVFALAGTHYHLITLSLGGLIATIVVVALYAVVKGVRNRYLFITNIEIYSLLILIVLLAIFLQGFYASFVGKIDISKVVENLIAYFTTFYKSPIYVKEELEQYVIVNPLYALALKTFTYTSLTYILLFAFSVILFEYDSEEFLSIVKTFGFILGGSVVSWLAYFVAYGYGNFGLQHPWLVVATILASSLAITRRKRDIPLITKQFLIRIGVLILTILVVSSTLVSFYFRAEQASSYNALTPPPVGVELIGKLVTTSTTERTIITGAHSTASRIYIQLAASSLENLQKAIVANSPYTTSVSKLCLTLQNRYDIVVVSSMDLTKGMFGDVSPSYLSPDIVMKLTRCLANNAHVILNSNNYVVFSE
jgi:hypothetical protein